MDLKGLSISDPQGDDDGEWPRKTGKGTAPVEHNFKFTKSDRDKEMAFLLKKFYQGELILEKWKQSLFMRLPFRRQPRPRAGGPLVRAARPVVGQLLRGVAQGDRGAGGGERAEPDPAAPRSLGPERGARGGDRGRRMGKGGGGRASLRGPPPQQPTPAPAPTAKAEAVSRPPPVRRQGRPPRSSPGTLCYKVRTSSTKLSAKTVRA